ncbi:MAG: AAA family ATPase [Mogibacterium sp.]|nr:AAA family ATPase [Mogibacterium sp.]
MTALENIRRTIDRLYHAKLWDAFGALTVMYAIKILLATSGLTSGTCWACGAAVGLAFYAVPAFSVILAAIAAFMAISHISGLMAAVIVLLMVLLYSSSHPTAWATIMMPLAFIPGSPLQPVGFAILFFGLCMYSKYEYSYKPAFFSTLWGAWSLFFCASGLPNFLYAEGFNFVPYQGKLDDIFNSFDLMRDYQILQTAGIQNFLIILGAFLVLGVIAHWLFVKARLIRTLNQDVIDAVSFLILTVLTIVVYVVIRVVCKADVQLPIGGAVIGLLVGYIVSRPWTSAVAIEVENRNNTGAAVARVTAVNSGETWDSLAGYEATKQEIQDIIKPYVDKVEFNKVARTGMRPVKGLLLYGPPGTGKTTIARIIANESKMNLILVNASEFMSKWVGESEQNLKHIFTQAKAKAPAIICFEEVEAFLRKRTESENNYETSIINVFLSQMDGFNELKNVFVVATTNNPEMIDEAAMRPGRFDRIIYVGAPDPEGRRALFKKYLKGKANLSKDEIDKLVKNTERFTGADIKAVCENAYRENDFKQLTVNDLLDRISYTLPSYTLDLQERYELYRKKYVRSSAAQQDNTGKETKKLTWDDIKGMDEVKKVLKDKIESPIRNAEKYKQFGIPASKGILLFGPPGCGKTFFAKVAADESDANFYVVNGPELLGAGIGESEKNLRRKFRDARETKPSIIFFDEIDAIAGKRSGNEGSVRIINQLLTEIDGMDSLDGVMVIAATNRPDSLDGALMRAGRFDTKIYIPLPDRESIRELLSSTLEPIPYDADIDLLAEKLDGYTCADIVAIANKAKEIYVKRQIIAGDDAEAQPVNTDDILGIINKVKSSVSEEDRKKYEAMKSLESVL